MKDNRKNRKLIYIRVRNKLRKGLFKIGTNGKIPPDFFPNNEFKINLLNELILDYSRKYKFDTYKTWNHIFEIGQTNDDFIKNNLSFVYRFNIQIDIKKVSDNYNGFAKL